MFKIHRYASLFQTSSCFSSGDHSGVVYTCIASRDWIKDSQLLSHISVYYICIYALHWDENKEMEYSNGEGHVE